MSADEAALMRLCIEFARRIDGGSAERVTELFTPDGVLESGGQRIVGAAALRERFARRQLDAALVTRHLLTNASFCIESQTRASGELLMTVFRRHGSAGPAQAPRVADVEDVYVREAAGPWRIAQRRLALVFEA
jgi:hypothetical protein